MITQGSKIIVARRQLDAPRPGQLCECGGVFEVLDSNPKDDPESVRNDYIASLLKESQEIILARGDKLYIPQLAPSPGMKIGFQPPGTLDAYNVIIEEEVKKEARKAAIPINPENSRKFWMKLLDYQHAVRLEYSYSPQLYVEITAEIDSSSLECVGVLSLPDNIDVAVVAFLEEKLLGLTGRAKSEADPINKAKLEAEIKDTEIELKKAHKEKAKAEEIQYWDSELGWDPKLEEESGPVDRDIYLINIRNGDVTVWFKKSGERKRISRESNIWTELSATMLGATGTGGRLATEKLEKAIKMHCPFAQLQPLIT